MAQGKEMKQERASESSLIELATRVFSDLENSPETGPFVEHTIHQGWNTTRLDLGGGLAVELAERDEGADSLTIEQNSEPVFALWFSDMAIGSIVFGSELLRGGFSLEVGENKVTMSAGGMVALYKHEGVDWTNDRKMLEAVLDWVEGSAAKREKVEVFPKFVFDPGAVSHSGDESNENEGELL